MEKLNLFNINRNDRDLPLDYAVSVENGDQRLTEVLESYLE